MNLSLKNVFFAKLDFAKLDPGAESPAAPG
jgi:hypothetical protein